MTTSLATTTGAAVLHACFAGGCVRLWAESVAGAESDHDASPSGGDHPFTLARAELEELLGVTSADDRGGQVQLILPTLRGVPIASDTLLRRVGMLAPQEGVGLVTWTADTVALSPDHAADVLDRILDAERHAHESENGNGRSPAMSASPSVEFFAVVCRYVQRLLGLHRFVPMMRQDSGGKLSGVWLPWLADERTAKDIERIVKAMPASARAVVDGHEHDPWRIIESCCAWIADAFARKALIAEEMFDTVEGRDAEGDPQIAWMHGLLAQDDLIPSPHQQRTEIVKRVRKWIGSLEERGQSTEWRLLLRLNEPLSDDLPDRMDDPGDDLMWSVSFHLQNQDDENVVVDAADVWLANRETMVVEGLSLESPQDLLLGELGRASRLYKPLEGALDDAEPIEILLDTKKAYEFYREHKPLLIEQGFGVESPAGWDSPAGRLGAKLRIDSAPLEQMMDTGSGVQGHAGPQLGLTALVGYHWDIAIGDTTLTLNEFEELAGKSSPLIRIGGRWVEIRPEDVKNAVEFIRANPGGEMKLAEALRLAYSTDPKQAGMPVLGMSATGWVAQILGGASGDALESSAESGEPTPIPIVDTPEGFHGTLRPYQQRGLSWLAFLERFGFGGCLADDMGLGKTVQLLALMVHEREQAEKQDPPAAVLPTLLIVPMSVVGNWVREAGRFAPQLKVLVHHGVDRQMGDDLVHAASESDIIVTTYALANRDHDVLDRIPWGRVVVDEAQFIKNPSAKQSVAVRSFQAERRIALTGTPVENRLSELWSIMDFLNPGYLGPSGQFRKRFSVPIERYRDAHRAQQLKGLVRPFILRRVKTDPTVVADLPEKLETREYSHLTSEQAALYESTVKRMLGEVEAAEGIHRRGLVLAALIRLKQICNHPAQMLKDYDFSSGKAPDPTRSGKCIRTLELLDEVLAEGERALVFTQFRQMGHLLSAMFRHELGREILFLHGGTPQKQREKLIERFQDMGDKAPILILSLKAGGVGLNLTAATHVFHFDRWWNPAVENQATDRAYRIGQTRTVHVHKFVVKGTLEERIDEMIEAKTELAERIIGAGERWLTELDSSQLRDLLTLRADALGDAAEE
ncbi:MAG: DEAD/DEAH box helicase [Planctomycetota bacterium]